VFVSACYSNQIGKMFSNAGIPVVISVNQNEGILDDCAKQFSSLFYSNLLKGNNIEKAFEKAKERISELKMEVCCCQHDHDDDCKWFQLKNKDATKAHDICTANKN